MEGKPQEEIDLQNNINHGNLWYYLAISILYNYNFGNQKKCLW